MNKAELVNRIWLLLAIFCPLTYYLYSQDNELFFVSGIVGSVSVLHSETKSEYEGWNDGIVLLAHALAVITIFICLGTLGIFYASKIDIGVEPIIVGLAVFFGSAGLAGWGHNYVQSHYDRIRESKEKNKL